MNEPKEDYKDEHDEATYYSLTEFNSSFKVDRRLFLADIKVNFAYCEGLFSAGILTRLETERIKNGLQAIVKRVEYDKNYFDELPSENIHSFVIARLVQLIGETGKKLLIGRSETEQTLTTLRLWLRRKIEEISVNVKEFQKKLIETAERQKEAVLPCFTNLQKAQTVLWTHWCLAYFEMFARDRERLDEVWRRVNVSPFGAETSFEIDREEIAAALQFEGVATNSSDASSDRDFVIEFVGACTLLMTHLSRFTRDVIVYNSSEFRFMEVKDTLRSNAVSINQKTNVESLELFGAKASRVFGHQIALLSATNSSSLNMQEEMKALFDTVETVESCLKAGNLIVKNLRVNQQKTKEAAEKDYPNYLELTDYLLKKDTPFEAAHETTRKIVAYAVAKNKEIRELNLGELQNFSADFEEDVFHTLTLEQSLASKNQIGGTAPERVFEALETARETLEREES
ncbi:MAG: argininosuccinate lyase [Acidobacteria bacterium]|nr:argininosuccinate lyase [Acidobacteriota bacterium]